MDIQLFHQHQLLKRLSFLHYIAFAPLSNNQLTILIGIYFWDLCLVPLIYLLILLPIWHYSFQIYEYNGMNFPVHTTVAVFYELYAISFLLPFRWQYFSNTYWYFFFELGWVSLIFMLISSLFLHLCCWFFSVFCVTEESVLSSPIIMAFSTFLIFLSFFTYFKTELFVALNLWLQYYPIESNLLLLWIVILCL